jgi:hypothetical protein
MNFFNKIAIVAASLAILPQVQAIEIIQPQPVTKSEVTQAAKLNLATSFKVDLNTTMSVKQQVDDQLAAVTPVNKTPQNIVKVAVLAE